MGKKYLERSSLGIPYFLFMGLFVVLPVLIILYYAFTNGQGQFSMENLFLFFRDGRTIGTLFYSLFVAVTVTCVCLVIAYPVAYLLAKTKWNRNGTLLLLFIAPMWINFTLRITALKEVLNLFEGNLAFHPLFNTIIGMTYDFLPFMILPIYNTITKIDKSYEEVARDLGAKPSHVLSKIIIPLSKPGIISGISMVFLPSMTNYVVLDMMYNSTYIMGSLIGSYFSMYDWHNGSVISMILLLIILISSVASGEFKTREEGGAFE
ncbi:MAG: ABC transporter permease [Eubacterium sp.]|nr:ABC transporter permease [Eubacterium sp.]